MKKILNFFKYIIKTTEIGFYYLCLIFSKGFFFYFSALFYLMEKIFHLKLFTKIKDFFKTRQEDPASFMMIVLVFLIGAFLHTYLYVDDSEVKFVDESVLTDSISQQKEETPAESIASDKETYGKNEVNLYRKYGSYDIQNIDFTSLKNTNSDVVAWLMVDGTNVNYPIVQSSNNDYYLNHDITKNFKASGWTFMDYRNSVNLEDANTIFYGHNLLNKTAFGSLANVFTDKWFNNSNHYIMVKTESVQHVYQVFSSYYIEPVVDYLQTNFYNNDDHQAFLNTIVGRSAYTYNVDVSVNDKIITLSTCTDDNTGRKVIHAKMIK